MVLYQRGNYSLTKFGIGYKHLSVPNSLKDGCEKMTEFKKIESEIKKFEKEGDSIQGVLIGVSTSKTPDGKDNKAYKIRTKENKVYTIFGTAVLNDRMQAVVLNQEVQIILTGFSPSKLKGRSPIKLFDVYVCEDLTGA